MNSTESQRCCTCKQVKDVSEFGKNRTQKSGLQARCRECYRVSNRAFRERNREYMLAAQKKYRQVSPHLAADVKRKYKYGITYEQYAQMYASQEGRCAVCDIDMDEPCVDHDHDTGAVRGLLCRHCNFGLGHFRDDPRRMARAIAYLTK